MIREVSVYVDESGDFGLSDRSSRYFVMCALATSNQVGILRVLKRVRKWVLRTPLKKIPELKWSESSPELRRTVLRGLAAQDNEMWYVCLCKVDRKKREDGNIYSDVAVRLISRVAEIKARKINVVVDRTLSRTNQARLNEQLEAAIRSSREKLGMIEADIRFKHATGQEEPCLQAVDYVSGAVFAKYEWGDPSYFEIIESRITKTDEMK
ncbi:MAG: DUF3800 domain-containing protein [Candidatus Thermoplasmatota archaeon]|nr:DUF3800 domain-containing protein [Euryarchaeota archaeon]MBU4032729.1 DUF3800 domain-containing protein [Candidatus Thermoplasmatota archaeon]MBU4144235.1 DUF3800 domain-containing protein [Candidatus Thermoplasmatota archaeon]MBU4591416.1 DUF3800 domain-containing protein [Candidatus Thermoplasmatota archaeon]